MRDRKPAGNVLWAVLLFFAAAFGFNGCGDVNNVTPTPGPGPLTILTSSPLPAGTTTVFYDITLAHSGGTPPYTWSLAPGSPALPDGLVLTPTTGNISGTPTTTGTTPTEFKLQDSKGQSVQKVLSITVNIAPTPLAILTNSLTPGTINQFYAFALSPTGGTTPYTWGLKAGSPSLPSDLTLSTNGVISGTPTVTSNDTHTFTLTDATSLTVEKPLQLSINAIPLSITTNSLPQGTAGQNYSAQLAALGGTGAYTWGSSALPTGLTLNTSTGLISGIPTGTSSLNHTFTVTDETPPTPQTATKTLQLIIGAAPPPLVIQTSSPLPSGTVTVPYSTTLVATGGTGTKNWDLVSGSLPVGLNLSLTGVISGTPTTAGTSSPTIRVRDSGTPQQLEQKQLSITINLPAAPSITTTALPNGSFNQAYDQTLGVTGGIPPLIWGVIAGGLPTGLNLNSSNGKISGTATATGKFDFTVEVNDAFQNDTQPLSITITAPALSITTASPLPIGTVNQTYPATTLQATGGTPPYTWDPVVSPALPLTWTASTATISGIPLAGSEGTANHTFTVRDSTNPIQTVQKALSLTINAALTINEDSLPAGTVGQAYNTALTASGGAPPYAWSITGTGAPSTAAPGLTLSSGGVISGTPTTAVGSPFTRTYRVQDNNGAFITKSLALTVNAALTIDTASPLPSGKVGDDYGTVTPAAPVTLTVSGGTPPYTWTLTTNPALPAGLIITPDPSPSASATISGVPTASESNVSHTFTVTDSTNLSANKDLSLTIDP